MKISIITVNFNNDIGLADTFASLKKFDKSLFELIVVDGSSSDNSLKICSYNEDLIDILITENDNGIFDAMNKGIKYSNCEWVYFLNSGDILIDLDFFNKIDSLSFSKFEVIYGDVMHIRKGRYFVIECEHKSGKLNHQAIIYKKELHLKYGLYSSNDAIIISDYFFLAQIPKDKFIKIDSVISQAQPGGISEKRNILQLRNKVDFFLGEIDFFKFLLSSFINFLWFRVRFIFR